jgi:hypothetical protein
MLPAGIKSPEQVLEMGIDKYNEECRSIVMRYAKEWEVTVTRLGRWIDFENDYKTLNLSFMESVWWVFGQLWEKDLVYEGFKVSCLATLLGWYFFPSARHGAPQPAVPLEPRVHKIVAAAVGSRTMNVPVCCMPHLNKSTNKGGAVDGLHTNTLPAVLTVPTRCDLGPMLHRGT